MRFLARLAALATLPLLAGCFDADISVTAQADGTTTLVSEIALAPADQLLAMMMPAETLAALPQAQKDAMVAQIADQMQTDYCSPDDTDVPEGVTVAFETETRIDGYLVCRQIMTGPIAAIAEAAAEGALDAGTDGPQITLTDEGNGVYLFHVLIPAGEDTGLDDATAAMLAAGLEGHFVTWSVTAPRIIETNGELDGTTATAAMPAGAIMGPAAGDFEFTVRFSL